MLKYFFILTLRSWKRESKTTIILSEIDLPTRQKNQIISRFLVGAIIKDPPANTHLQFDLLRPINAIDKVYFTMESHIFATYLLFDRRITDDLYSKTTQRMEELLAETMKSHSILSRISMELQSLNDIRFGSTMYVDISPQGNKQTIRIFILSWSALHRWQPLPL